MSTAVAESNGDRIHDEAALRLGALDQRYTSNRREIVQVLAAADRPLTITEIVDVAPSVPVSSAYRSLTVLADARVVRRVAGTDDTGRFELAEDLSQHHHHLICSSCGTVVDVAASPRLERALAEAATAAAEESDFEVHEHRIDLVGRCSNCR
jgi:Fur family transcriptional regulator, ferric uptake regulator